MSFQYFTNSNQKLETLYILFSERIILPTGAKLNKNKL